jgi:hypothetical protein
VDELAHDFMGRLGKMGVQAEREEVVQAIEGKAANSMLRTIIEAWMNDELRRGVTVV